MTVHSQNEKSNGSSTFLADLSDFGVNLEIGKFEAKWVAHKSQEQNQQLALSQLKKAQATQFMQS